MEDNKAALIGIGILVLATGLSLWYMASHPAPSATTAPATAQAVPDQHLVDNGQYYTADAVYPGSTPLAASAGAAADAQAIATMKAFEEKTIATFKQDGNFANLTPEDVRIQGLDQGRTYELKMTYEATSSPHTVSYIYLTYEDTLGAHPNAFYDTFTFDRTTGALLALKDVFVPGTAYLPLLSKAARAALPAMIAARENTDVSQVDMGMLNEGTTPDEKNFKDFYFNPAGDLTFIFPPYQVGPYVLGSMTLSIPSSALKDALKLQYRAP